MPTFTTVRPDVTVEVRGADRLAYLDAVTSQHLADQPGRTVTSALELDAHGAIVSAFDVVVLEDRVLLVAPTPHVAAEVTARLGSRTFLSDAGFVVTDLAVVSLRGDGVEQVASTAGLDVAAGRAEPRVGAIVAAHRRGGVDVLVQPDEVDAVVGRLTEAGATRDDDGSAWNAWQVVSGEPRWGVELSPPHLPEELGLLPTHVHLAKGCYPGQEAVARMWMLGRPRRRLARIEVVAGEVAEGWRHGEGRRSTEVTGVVGWDGRRLGLAFVPDGIERGDVVGGPEASIRILEVLGEGVTVPGQDPNVVRRRDRRGA